MTFRTRLARIGYVLGTALVVAAVFYFFASNWGGMPRGMKTLLSACMTAVFYALAFITAALSFWRKHGDFLPLVFLFAGVMAFGGTAALLNAIYNTHADEWRLFAVWFVPALMFSVLLRNVWFYALAYVIGHLAMFFLFFPGTYFISYTDWQQAGIFGWFGIVNLLLYLSAERGWWRAGFVKPVSLAVFLASAVWLSNSFVLGTLGHWLNLLSLAVLAACFRLFGRRRDSLALSLTGLAASFYAVLKFLELMEDHYSELFFFFGLVFVALLMTGNVLFFRHVARLGADGPADAGGLPSSAGHAAPAPDDSSSTTEHAGQAPSGVTTSSGHAVPVTEDPSATFGHSAPASHEAVADSGLSASTPHEAVTDSGHNASTPHEAAATSGHNASTPHEAAATSGHGSVSLAARVAGTVVTIVGTIIGTVSLVGLLMLAGESWNEPGLAVFAAGVLMIAAMSLVPRLNATVRNTGLLIGLAAGNFSIFAYQEAWANLVILASGVLCWFFLQGTPAKIAAHFIVQLTLVFFLLGHLDWHMEWALLLLAAANGFLYAMHERINIPSLRRPLELASPLFMLVALFWLTFFKDVFKGSHALFNVLYFVLTTGLIVLSVRRRRHYDTTLFMTFWLLFAGFKYYDLLWDLLHKSLTMLLLGAILVAVSALLDRNADRGRADHPGTGNAGGTEGIADPENGKAEGQAGREDGQAGWPNPPDRPNRPDKHGRLLPYRNLAAVLAILALQFAYIGGEIAVRETQFARGTTIRLAIHPEDLKYYLGGRATWVRYTISELPEPMASKLRESGLTAGGRIRLVLSPDADGVYQIDRLYRGGETVRQGEVVISGRFDGWSGVRYGIESRDPDREGGDNRPRLSSIVKVRVSASGNAMLEE